MSRVSWVFLIVLIILRLIFWLLAFPNSDEAYYWLWGQHPALSYYDHPPLQAWIQGGCTWLFGRSQLVLRLPNLVSNGLFFYAYYLICRYLYPKPDNQKFLLIITLVLASPLYFLFLALAWHDHLLITFSLLSAYGFIRFLDSYLLDGRGKSSWLYVSAVAIAVAGLSKYNAVFIPLAYLVTLLSDRRFRPLLGDRRFYGATMIAVAALLPVLLWNISHDFQSLRYYFNRSVNPVQPGVKIGSFITFLATSFLLVSPFHWIGFYRLFKFSDFAVEGLRPTNSIYIKVAFNTFLVSSIILTGISLISASLYYWNITAYLLLIPLLPLIYDSYPKHLRRWRYLQTQVYGLAIAGLLVIHYTVLPLSALVSPEADFDSRLLFGWPTVAAQVVAQITPSTPPPFLVTTDYRSASALAYQLNQRDVVSIGDRVDQFDVWYGDGRSLEGRNAVILTDDWFPLTPSLKAHFQQVSEPMKVPIGRFGIWIKNYYLYQGTLFSTGVTSH